MKKTNFAKWEQELINKVLYEMIVDGTMPIKGYIPKIKIKKRK